MKAHHSSRLHQNGKKIIFNMVLAVTVKVSVALSDFFAAIWLISFHCGGRESKEVSISGDMYISGKTHSYNPYIRAF